MEELNFVGNALKGSRHILSFDPQFETSPHLQLIKHLLTSAFAVPPTSRKMKPFVDHVLSFTIADDRIWFRNYQVDISSFNMFINQIQVTQVVENKMEDEMELVEIGARFVLNPLRIFAGSFGGPTLYQNTEFVPPSAVQAAKKQEKADTYLKRKVDQQAKAEVSKKRKAVLEDPFDDVFRG
jgi:ribosome biogenesis protein BRX1